MSPTNKIEDLFSVAGLVVRIAKGVILCVCTDSTLDI